jgi:uncharacterized protein (DUF983 family)
LTFLPKCILERVNANLLFGLTRRDTFTGMSSTGSTPQFKTAEYSSAGEVCKSCKKPLSGDYFRINGIVACENCTEQLRRQLPVDSSAAFIRAIAIGIGAAVLGCGLYAGFTILTSIYIGIVSLAVGWLIGKAMKMGSGGIGGKRYQIVAVALTYIAVSMADVPINLHFRGKSLSELTDPALFGQFLVDGITSPFTGLRSATSGLIGLVILFVGMQIAWKLTAGPKLEILGPFQATSSGALPTSSS